MPSFTRWLWHGAGSERAWASICEGRGLELPTKHVTDVGDYGLGVYFTDELVRAKVYAVRAQMDKGKKLPLVRALIYLKKPLVFDWKRYNVLSPKAPSSKLLRWLTSRFGDPVRGKDRERAAHRWREGLLALGRDGIVAYHARGMEVVAYLPHRAVLAYECMVKKAK